MIDIYKVVNELNEVGYPKNVLYKYNFLKFVQPGIDSDGMDNLLNSIESITKIDKQLFDLRYKSCMTIVDIAKQTGLTKGYVTGRLERTTFLIVKLLKEQHLVIEKPIESNGKLRVRL